MTRPVMRLGRHTGRFSAAGANRFQNDSFCGQPASTWQVPKTSVWARAAGRPPARKPIPAATKREVLTEAGYRCAVPAGRTTLAIDLHHLVRVVYGAGTTYVVA